MRFFRLRVSSVGISADTYRHLTSDLTLAIARQLLPANPQMIFEYISGEGTHANSGQKWAQVKAKTEAVLFVAGFHDLPFDNRAASSEYRSRNYYPQKLLAFSESEATVIVPTKARSNRASVKESDDIILRCLNEVRNKSPADCEYAES